MNGNAVLIGVAIFAAVLMLRMLLNRSRRIPKEALMELVAQGAQVVDVRTPQEFVQAHATGSRNIPLGELAERMAELAQDRPVVVCCASGTRSAMAKSMLERAGFTSVHNAGSWRALEAA